ncbi:hypothetical protein ABZ589_35825 [Streptomyces sp. NPDC013313]|uniref:hypothetical protein n=1 Tax=Streptomyces sp. NPDC013313 TaxID=3155603 RepID=UPI00340A44C5
MSTESMGWTALTEATASQVLADMQASGAAQLQQTIVRFLRALALEVGSAVEVGKTPPGLPIDINGIVWYSIPIPWENVFFNYSIYPAERQIRVCDLIWVSVD